MCDRLHWFRSPECTYAVALPFSIDEWIAALSGLRSAMRLSLPPEFSRDEWAYLMSFLSPERLEMTFTRTFGVRGAKDGEPQVLARPIGNVAVWLPNNVSLLGPLTLILLLLTGNRLRLKGGSRSKDLTGAFREFVLRHVEPQAVRDYIKAQVQFDVFDREDKRQQEMVNEADVRIVFGSDEAAAAIHRSAPPLKGRSISFVDRQSQAWIEPEAVDDGVLAALIRVFAIYGQAGCTAPRRLVLLDGAQSDAVAVRDRMLRIWPEVLKSKPPVHVASANTMAHQLALAGGWDACLAANRHAVLGVGSIELEPIDEPMFLSISAATVGEALERLPANIQTIGYAAKTSAEEWLQRVVGTRIKRLVPIARMHDFGPLWDGENFWRQCFEEVEVDF
jgi:hypothetical protein